MLPSWERTHLKKGGNGGGNGNPLQYSCLEDSMDRGAWWAAVHGGHMTEHTCMRGAEGRWVDSNKQVELKKKKEKKEGKTTLTT